jgi:hypothetical protein
MGKSPAAPLTPTWQWIGCRLLALSLGECQSVFIPHFASLRPKRTARRPTLPRATPGNQEFAQWLARFVPCKIASS